MNIPNVISYLNSFYKFVKSIIVNCMLGSHNDNPNASTKQKFNALTYKILNYYL